MRDILEVIKNVQSIYTNNSSLAILKDFERVMDEMDMYVYKNWKDGELASGPKVERHWVTAEFMWPYDKMPDPVAAKRLTDLGCKVHYEKTNIVEPRKIRSPDDLRPGTKKGKLDTKPVWVVGIMMPKKLVFDIFNGYMDRIREERQSKEPSKKEAGAGGAAAPTAAPAAPAGGAPAAAPGGAPV
jgi:hypothetical protein